MRKVTEDFIGTCQACFGEFKVNEASKLIVLHGYQRPGIGFILGNCEGHDHAPFEYDFQLTKTIIVRHHQNADKQQKRKSELSTLGYAGPLTRRWDEYNPDTRRNETRSEEVTPGHAHWDRTLQSAIQTAIARHNHHIRFAEFLQQKVDAWKRGQIVGIDVRATGRERALRKAYDPVEADAMEERAKIKAARDAKPGKLKITFYTTLDWPSNEASHEERRAFFEKEDAEKKARIERLKVWAKANYEGKVMVRESYDSDLPRSVRDRNAHYHVVCVHLPWEYRDAIKDKLAVAESFISSKKVDYFVEGEP
ncbi:hypothetical protein [Sphingobium sp. MK2]|uniref:hypothetical protein n=1 Tax=Sphingobium sp. MK2 TaxID=3116540 RepID=UPI0032E35F0D